MEKLTNYLIAEYKQWYKLATVRFWALVAVLAQLAEIIQPFSTTLDPGVANTITAISVVSIALRLYKQKGVNRADGSAGGLGAGESDS